MVDKITTGIRGLWARSLPGMAGLQWPVRRSTAFSGRQKHPCR